MLRKSRKGSAGPNVTREVYVDELINQTEEKHLREEVEKLQDLTLARQTMNEIERMNKTMSVSKARLINKIAGIDDYGLNDENLDEYIEMARRKKADIERVAEINRQRMLTEEEWHKTQLMARREVLNSILPPVEDKVKATLAQFKEKIRDQNDALDRELKDLYQRGQVTKLKNDIQQMNSLIANRQSLLPRSDDDFKLRRLYLAMDIYNRTDDEFTYQSNYSKKQSNIYDCLSVDNDRRIDDFDKLSYRNDRRLAGLDIFDGEVKRNGMDRAEMMFNDYWSRSTLFYSCH